MGYHAATVAFLDRPGEHVDLQVRPFQPLVAPHKGADEQSHAGERTGAAEGVAHAGPYTPRQAVGEVVHCDRPGALVGDVGVEVVVQVAAHTWHVLDDLNAVLLQVRARPEPRQH